MSLNQSQQQFASLVARQTGLAPRVVAAWVASEEPGSINPNQWGFNWLNLSAAGNSSGVNPATHYPKFANVQQAASAVSHLINTSGYYGGIRQAAKGGNPMAQLNAIWQSPWAGGHYNHGSTLIGAYNGLSGLNLPTPGQGSGPGPAGPHAPAQGPQTQGLTSRQVLSSALWGFAQTGNITDFLQQPGQPGLTPPISRKTGNVPGFGGNTNPAIQKALQFGHNAVGTPYVWGGESTKGYDCSGLAQAMFAHAGISIPRTTYDQIKVGKGVQWGQFRPGDLIFSNFEGGKTPTHVVIYVGNGKVIAAPHTGTTVQYESVNVFRKYFVGARRVA